jgi:cytochrome P450
MILYEDLANLEYTQMFFKESMRIEPPVTNASPLVLTENTKIGPYTIRKNDLIFLHMFSIHHDETQWIEPSTFNPERFNPESKFFKTPSGEKRHPMSFLPYIA